MNKTQTVILVIVAVVVLGLLVYVGMSQQSPENGKALPSGENGEAVENGEGTGPVGELEAKGASPVDEGGRVVTDEGKPVDQTAEPGSPNAPKQTAPISEEELPKEAIKLHISASGFEPNEFTVKRGAVVTISVTAVDEQTHIFKFTNPVLRAVAIGVGPGETRAITFNAPEEKGTYEFFCDVPGHAQRGETGTMIVK